MWSYWPFSDGLRDAITGAGLNWQAIENIMRPPSPAVRSPQIRGECPAGLRKYLDGEYRAAETSFQGLRAGRLAFPDPWGGPTPLAATGCGLRNVTKSELYGNPLIYRCKSEGRLVYAVSYNLTGRITQLIFPQLQVIIFDIFQSNAELMATLFEANREQIDALMERRQLDCHRVVGVIDMVFNYGHHMMNHLSGLERLVSTGLHDSLNEVWVSGIPFFGEIAEIFPEIARKLRLFSNQGAMLDAILAENVLPLRVGSNVFSHGLRQRLLDAASRRIVYPADNRRFPLVAVTIRGGGRACLNLGEVVAHLHRMLSPHFPNIGYVLDGWVFPEALLRLSSGAATCLWPDNLALISREMAAAGEVADALPRGAVVRNLIGQSILHSISGLRDIDAYFAHVGTLQHKLGFLTHARGFVHGPKRQMTHFDAGTFATESGLTPKFVDPACVVDVDGSGGIRGEGFANYRISDLDNALKPMLQMLKW